MRVREKLLRPSRERCETTIEADEKLRIGRARRRAYVIKFLIGERERFLDKHVPARAQTGCGEARVRVVARGDDDEIDGGVVDHLFGLRRTINEPLLCA